MTGFCHRVFRGLGRSAREGEEERKEILGRISRAGGWRKCGEMVSQSTLHSSLVLSGLYINF